MHSLIARLDVLIFPPNRMNTAKDETTAAKPVDSIIAEHPFLAGLKPAHLKILQENAMRMFYQPDEFIFREGDLANRFYLIESGKVSLESQRRDLPPVPIQIIGAGDVLGWSWLFPPCHWHFDARAIEPITAIFFYGTRVREQCEEDHDLGYELMKRMVAVVIRRLQATRKQLLAVSV
jgi:CRP/FNR family cyclic AMP-dependent transcriptional regulator